MTIKPLSDHILIEPVKEEEKTTKQQSHMQVPVDGDKRSPVRSGS